MQSIILLGSTGSIGTQTLDVAREHSEKMRVSVLSANNNWALLARQVREFEPDIAVLGNSSHFYDFKNAVGPTKTELVFGTDHIQSVVQHTDAHLVVNALVGFSGFLPTVAALNSGKRVALANKESLVIGGELLQEFLGLKTPKIFPIDSEHSAILQCMVGEQLDEVEKIIITASGGPFRDFEVQQLASVTVEDALKHPNWDMGAKITIDSATMMNKGLEVIEACWLFGLPLDAIDAVIHPQSIIHSMVTFIDGSTKAQLGRPDMKVPIQYALSYPERWTSTTNRLDWAQSHEWSFRPIQVSLYPCFHLALDAKRIGGIAPAVLNASNEVAVHRFLQKEIPYIGIPKIVEKCLENIHDTTPLTLKSIVNADAETRKFARTLTI
jgi:1-deoxy-D-xylulose-5-phosphate reductoisomerase